MSLYLIENIDYPSLDFDLQDSLMVKDEDTFYYRYDFRDFDLCKQLTEKLTGILKRNLLISPRFYLTHYTAGGFIKSHQDGKSQIGTKVSTHTLLLYLNDDYQGGELVLETLGVTIKPVKGTVLLMNQDLLHHCNEVVGKNKKYSELMLF